MKNGVNLKFKTKSLTVALVALFLLSTLAGTQLIGNVSAAIAYTEYAGTLPGGDWVLRIPNPWNGMLVVGCRAYMGATAIPSAVSSVSQLTSILNAGFAVAGSNYGAAGFCLLKGVDSTYELTTYLIENYGITGKVFLVGWSMGGSVALLLGEKYPEVYSGVLDMYGGKDWKDLYRVSKRWANLSDEDLSAELTALGIPVPPPGYTTLQSLRNFLAGGVADQELATGGTPTTVPQVYEACSPTYHADIMIPVITVHGTADPLVPHYQSDLYKAAVAKAYHSNLYRLYNVTGGGHGSGFPATEQITRFDELVEWSNELTGSSDWPMYRQNVQHTGCSTSNAPTTNQTLWAFTAGNALQCSPSVADGKVYVGSFDKNMYCLDAATGALIWNYTTGAMIFSSPAVADGKVYFGSYDDKVYCLDAATGGVIWSYTADDQVWSSPAVANGKVYVGSQGGKLYCFRADWGQVEWIFTTSGAVQSSPAVADGKVYVGSNDGKLYCVGAASGALVWSYTTGGQLPSAPAVADGRVFVGSTDHNVYCLNALTGAKIWSYTTGDQAHNPAIYNGKVYVGSSDDNLYCLDAVTGALVWSYTAGGNVGISSPAVADGKVYFGSYDGKMHCLNVDTGVFIWSYQTGSSAMFNSGPAVANGVVYVACSDRMVYAFSAWAPIPEGLTIGAMLLLSTIAVIVSIRYFRKRPKWKNW